MSNKRSSIESNIEEWKSMVSNAKDALYFAEVCLAKSVEMNRLYTTVKADLERLETFSDLSLQMGKEFYNLFVCFPIFYLS